MHRCDGPVTSFVAISRACELAAKGTFPPDVLANALDSALVDLFEAGGCYYTGEMPEPDFAEQAKFVGQPYEVGCLDY